MLLSTLLLTLFPTVYAVASKPPKCLNSGTEEAINLALKTGAFHVEHLSPPLS